MRLLEPNQIEDVTFRRYWESYGEFDTSSSNINNDLNPLVWDNTTQTWRTDVPNQSVSQTAPIEGMFACFRQSFANLSTFAKVTYLGHIVNSNPIERFYVNTGTTGSITHGDGTVYLPHNGRYRIQIDIHSPIYIFSDSSYNQEFHFKLLFNNVTINSNYSYSGDGVYAADYKGKIKNIVIPEVQTTTTSTLEFFVINKYQYSVYFDFYLKVIKI